MPGKHPSPPPLLQQVILPLPPTPPPFSSGPSSQQPAASPPRSKRPSSPLCRHHLPLRLLAGQVLEIVADFKYLGSFVRNGLVQDEEINRRIRLAVMTFGKLESMVFTSKKVSLRVKNIQPWFLSVPHWAVESWALSKTRPCEQCSVCVSRTQLSGRCSSSF